jgi:hypothetical protein
MAATAQWKRVSVKIAFIQPILETASPSAPDAECQSLDIALVNRLWSGSAG